MLNNLPPYALYALAAVVVIIGVVLIARAAIAIWDLVLKAFAGFIAVASLVLLAVGCYYGYKAINYVGDHSRQISGFVESSKANATAIATHGKNAKNKAASIVDEFNK
jgi:hypothetical protein